MAVNEEVHATEIAGGEVAQEGENEQNKQESHVSRAEKKTLKQLQRLGLKQLSGFTKCEIRRGRGFGNAAFPVVINDPIVFEVPGKVPTYVVLGQIRVDSLQEKVQALQQKHAAAAKPTITPTVVDMSNKNAAVANTPDEEVDTTGLNPDDIKLAIDQTGKSKAQVVAELRKSDGDVIEAIMQLSN